MQPATRFLLLRHGESAANVAGLIAASPANACDDFGLTPRGRHQVRRSLSVLRSDEWGRGSWAIVTSPLLRARETAALARELLGGEVQVDGRLVERGFGELELGPDAWYRQVWEVDRADPGHRQWGVEPLTAILGRVFSLLEELDRQPAEFRFLLCTHGDVASTLLCAAQGARLSRHREVGGLSTGELRGLTWPWKVRGVAG